MIMCLIKFRLRRLLCYFGLHRWLRIGRFHCTYPKNGCIGEKCEDCKYLAHHHLTCLYCGKVKK